jgi:beta-methylarginine biosynthesis bifunctional aminotransferase
MPELIQAVSRWESDNGGVEVPEANVLITAGGLHAAGLIFRDCAAQGYERVFCPDPVFVGIADAAASAGLDVEILASDRLGERLSDLDRGFPERSVLYLNLPANPTGATLDAPLAYQIGQVVDSHRTFVVFDAVYSSFDFGAAPVPAPVGEALGSERIAVFSSMSKNFGRPGDRVGWIIAHESVVARLLPRLEWEVVAVAAAPQLAAAEVLAFGNEELVAAVRLGRETYRRVGATYPVLDRPLPVGGTQLWVGLGVDDAEKFADFAMHNFGLLLTGPANYLPVHPGHIRLPTGLPAELIKAGIDALTLALSDWSTR